MNGSVNDSNEVYKTYTCTSSLPPQKGMYLIPTLSLYCDHRLFLMRMYERKAVYHYTLSYYKVILLQASGLGGVSENARADSARVEEMKPDRMRKLTVEFTADTNSTMAWNFKPQQNQIKVSQCAELG